VVIKHIHLTNGLKLLSVVILLLLASCSTLTKNPQTPLTVLTVCAGSSKPYPAKCIISNPYIHKEVITPAVVAIERSSHDLNISCSIDNKVFGEAVISSSTDIDVTGNILIGGVIGVVTDFVSGNAYEYQPKIQLLLDCEKLTQSSD
tara:strand:+ start:238 stop:678 length:441 start_codon:yes stop_codon:yes gene_type:complete